MGQQISAAAESTGHHHAHLALGESQAKIESGDSGAKSLPRRGHSGLVIPTASLVPAKADGFGPGDKSGNKTDQEIGRMSIRAAIDTFIENCLSSSNENSEKHIGDELDGVNGLGRLNEDFRGVKNNDLKSGKKSPGEHSESGVESISSDSTDIQEAYQEDAEEKQLVIDCDGSSETKVKVEPKEGSHNSPLDGLVRAKFEKGREPKKETESGKKPMFSPSMEKQPFPLYVQDHLKKPGQDQQEIDCQSKDALQPQGQSISLEMAKKSNESPPPGGSEFPLPPVRLQTLIDKVLDQSLTNQVLDNSNQPLDSKLKKLERPLTSDDRNKEMVLPNSNKKGPINDVLVPEIKEAIMTGDKRESDSKSSKNTLSFKDHIEKVLMESFLSYEEEEQQDALKRGENPDDISKAPVHEDLDTDRQNTKKEAARPGAERPVNVQDIVDRVISQTQVISKLMTPEGQTIVQPPPVTAHHAQPHPAQPHPSNKYQSSSTPTKALQEAQRYAVHKEQQSSNIGRKRGRPRLGSPGIWPANDSGKDAKAAYAEQRAREYRNSQGPQSHHLPQQLPHLPTHQDRLAGTSVHGNLARAPLPVEYGHHTSPAYGMTGPSVYQHRHSQQRQPGLDQSQASKSGMPPGIVPASSAYHHSSQESFHSRGANLQQQPQVRSHQHHGHPKPPPPLILADNISEKNSLSRIVPVSHMPTKSCSCHSCVSHFSQSTAPHAGQKQERTGESQSHYPPYQLTSRRNLPHPPGAESLRPVLTISGQNPFPTHAIIPSYASGHRQHDGPPSNQQSGNRDSRYYDNKGRNPSPGHFPAYNSQMTIRQDVGYSESARMPGRLDTRYPDKSPISRQDSRYPENFHMPNRQESRYSENNQIPSRESKYSENVQALGRQENRYLDSGHVPRQDTRYPENSQPSGRTEARYTDHMPRHLEPYDLTDPAGHEKGAQPIIVDPASSPAHVRLAEVPASSEGDQPLDLSVKPVVSGSKELRRKPSDVALQVSGHESRQSYRTVTSELPAGSNYLDYERGPSGHHLQRLENSVDRILPQNPLPQFRQTTSQPALMDTRERHNNAPLSSLRERHLAAPQLLHPPESPSHKSVRHALPSPSLPPPSQHVMNSSASPVGHPYSSTMSPGGLHRLDSSPNIQHFHTSDSHLKQSESVAQRPSSHSSDVEAWIVPSSGQRSPSPDESEAQRMGVSKHEPIQNIIGSHPPSDILYLICRLCRQTYGSPYGFRKHFRNQHGFEPKAEHTIVQTISATKTAMANSVESLPQSPVIEYNSAYEDGKRDFTVQPRDIAGQPNFVGLEDIKSDYTKYLECPECQQLFRLNDFGSYKRHCRQHSLHRMSGPFACHECQKCFSEPSLLQEHLETHSTFTTSVCGICQNYFSSPAYLAEHIKAAHQLVYPGDRPDKASSLSDGNKRIKEELSPQPEALQSAPEISELGSSQGRATANHLPLTKRHKQFSPANYAQMFTVHTPKGLEIEKLPADGVVTTASPDSSYDDCQPGSAGAQVDTPAGESESARLVTGQGVKAPGLTKTSSSDILRSQSKDDTESNSSDCSANLESQSAEGVQTNSSEDIDKFYKHKKYSRYRKRSSPTNLPEPDKKIAKIEENSSTKEPGASITSSASVTSTFNSGVTLQDCESSCQQSEDSNSSSCFKSPCDDVKKQTGASADKAKSKVEDAAKTGSEDAGTKFKWDRLTRSQAGKAFQPVSYTSS
ncbi:uncharacterized protein LOC106054768 [Biomphalaria glabrata]|uniref:Uncharacterized protein LOC106054768 n=1 Tax=Biomphalaria glabrata TaxID=6526 RepID=A0A9U8DY30_BIOGL|nr:uncharacterized protein LOC106054768 [Biomphalaria glabrata]